MSWKAWRRIRVAVQILSFTFYITLIFTVVERRVAPPLADIFFRFDPLSALGAMLATRAWIPNLGLALITLTVTLVIGRVWCGSVAPWGACSSGYPSKKHAGALNQSHLAGGLAKYFLLVTSLALALFGSLSLLAFDPLAIFTRTLTTSILPGLFYAVNSLETALYHMSFLTPALDGFEELARGTLIPVEQPAFTQNLAIAALFASLVSVNLLAHRFWCLYLCPLGGLLGLLSKFSLFHPVIGADCTQCTLCAIKCKPGAIDTHPDNFHVIPSECTMCLDCMVASCKADDIHLRLARKSAPREEFDLSRREALGALATGAAGVLLLGTDLRLRQDNSRRIRPPGVVNEDVFLSTCLRCSQCMKICPTTALQPAWMEAGLSGLWTPLVIPRVGYCDFGCTACGQVCPSGAIPLLELEQKRRTVIGKASLDRDRCLPWASAVPCVVCEEMCPLAPKAIRLEEAEALNSNSELVYLQRPVVLRELCIGCGICEHHCPLESEAAIRIYDA